MKKHSTPQAHRALPASPNWEHLQKQAKTLLKSYLSGQSQAIAEVHRYERNPDPHSFRLVDAQRILARAYGFASWARLKQEVLKTPPPKYSVQDLCDAAIVGDVDKANAIIDEQPNLALLYLKDDSAMAIHFAVMHRQPEMVRLLMSCGVNKNSGIYPFTKATSPIGMATDRGYDEIVEIINEEYDRREQPDKSDVIESAPTKSEGLQTPEGRTLLLGQLRQAISDGEIETFDELVAKEITVAEVGSFLQLAVDSQQTEIVRRMMSLGVDPDGTHIIYVSESAPYVVGGDPLYRATSTGQHEMARLLLKAGADPNLQVLGTGTPMAGAFSTGNQELIELVKSHGGIVGIESAAKFLSYQEFAELFDSQNPKVDEQLLIRAVHGGIPETVQHCLKHFPQKISTGLLGQAARFWRHKHSHAPHIDRENYFRIYEILLKHGVKDLNEFAKAEGLHTKPGTYLELHSLGRKEPEEDAVRFAKLLLKHGARLDVLDLHLLSTPLGWAARWGKEKLVQLYLDHGADPNLCGAPWAAPIEWARKKGHDGVVELLSTLPGKSS